MYLPEPVDVINKRLKERYGLFEDGQANWRVSFGLGITDIELVSHVAGIQLAYPEYRRVLKYPFDQDKYILERLQPVAHIIELVDNISYEPVWTFEDKDHMPLPPKWEAIEYIIDTVQQNMASAGKGITKYPHPEHMMQTPEAIQQRVDRIEKELFGNSSPTLDSLAIGEGVGFTTSNIKES